METLPRFIIERVELPTEFIGSMYDAQRNLICKTMELPWRNNAVGNSAELASCIAYGVHVFEKMPGNEKYPDGYFRARKIKGRLINSNYKDKNGNPMSSILMHPITYVKDLRGCIGCGSRFADVNGDNIPDMVESRAKLRWMVKNLPDVFEVEIIKKP
jgi:hypothetical protein